MCSCGRPDILALLSPQTPDTWPEGILAAAEVREQRAKALGAMAPPPWRVVSTEFGTGLASEGPSKAIYSNGQMLMARVESRLCEHIAAEASPAHALAAVRRWRGVVERHARIDDGLRGYCRQCYHLYPAWPCPDLTETADEARDYVSGGPE